MDMLFLFVPTFLVLLTSLFMISLVTLLLLLFLYIIIIIVINNYYLFFLLCFSFILISLLSFSIFIILIYFLLFKLFRGLFIFSSVLLIYCRQKIYTSNNSVLYCTIFENITGMNK